MSKTKISQYDASADGNTDVNGVNIAEGCAPSGINNAIREVMAAVKRFETGSDGDSVTVGGNFVVVGSTTANTIGATVVNASGNATVGGTLVVTGATTFSSNVVISGTTTVGSTTATTISATVVQSDTISEKTSAAGVTIDGVLLKDTTVTANSIKASGTSSSEGRVELYEDTDNGTNFIAIKAPASVAANVTFTLPNADGTANQVIKTDGSGNLSFVDSSSGAPPTGLGTLSNTQTFTSSGTWTKPASGDYAIVRVWGGGGAGGRGGSSNNQCGGGGGGGAMVEKIFKLSDLGATETVTIGAGGTGTNTANTAGANGGNSTFGSHVTAYGGGGGGGGPNGQGGGGGGDASAGGQGGQVVGSTFAGTGGTSNVVTLPAGVNYIYTSVNKTRLAVATSFGAGADVPRTDAQPQADAFTLILETAPATYSFLGGVGGGGVAATLSPSGAGGGGAAGGANAYVGSGSGSLWGGGGGGSGIATSFNSGAAAQYLGNGSNIVGGNGSSNANTAGNGSQPACGGGGSENGASGNGGAGQCTVWVFTA